MDLGQSGLKPSKLSPEFSLKEDEDDADGGDDKAPEISDGFRVSAYLAYLKPVEYIYIYYISNISRIGRKHVQKCRLLGIF